MMISYKHCDRSAIILCYFGTISLCVNVDKDRDYCEMKQKRVYKNDNMGKYRDNVCAMRKMWDDFRMIYG